MPSKPNSRNWNDIQIAIATVSIVSTLGLWNLFAETPKPVIQQVNEPVVPPTEAPVSAAQPTAIPQAQSVNQTKIIFTQVAPQSSTTVTQQQTVKKKKNNNNNSNSGGTVTTTKTS